MKLITKSSKKNPVLKFWGKELLAIDSSLTTGFAFIGPWIEKQYDDDDEGILKTHHDFAVFCVDRGSPTYFVVSKKEGSSKNEWAATVEDCEIHYCGGKITDAIEASVKLVKAHSQPEPPQLRNRHRDELNRDDNDEEESIRLIGSREIQ